MLRNATRLARPTLAAFARSTPAVRTKKKYLRLIATCHLTIM